MFNIKIIKSIIEDYGISWTVNRSLYSAKLKILNAAPMNEKIFEKKFYYPNRLDIFNIDIEKIKSFLISLPNREKEELVIKANDACRGKVLGFSSVSLDYGYPINWQLNPLTGKQCDFNKKWYQIPDFDKERGDIKVIWEISRFSHFIVLARAYLLTGEIKYYEAFSKQLLNWLNSNLYSYGANYKCGQECSLRMINALLAYTIFYKSGVSNDHDKTNIKDLISRCYRRIRNNFFYAYRCIKNNHTISELIGIVTGAYCCENKKELDKAYRLLDDVIDEQFTDDGGYKQYSFNYQRLVLQDIECLYAMSNSTKHEISEKNKLKILKSAELLYQCQDESGDVPNYGSNDGALVFPVTSCEYRDYRPVIGSIYSLFGEGSPYVPGIYDEECLWFGNADKRVCCERHSSSFQLAGLYTFRGSSYWLMSVLNKYSSRPSHMDQQHFDLWIKSRNVFCDGGTYSYANKLGHTLICNEAHNTVVYKKCNQMNIHVPFMIYDWTKSRNIKISDGYFYGTMISKNGYEHSREIKSENNKVIIKDFISGSPGAGFEIRLHTPFEIEKDGKNCVIFDKGERLCSIEFEKEIEIVDSLRSLYYLKKDMIKVLIFKGTLDSTGDKTILMKISVDIK